MFVNAHFVKVDKDVKLEVLDWGGEGEYMVLLTGMGNSAHIFDDLAYQFTDKFHVLGITRRGFGLSSKPAQGYDIKTRLADDIKVLDHFNIVRAIFVGHSIAGVELSGLGAEFPDRVSKLVYLDAYDYGASYFEMLQYQAYIPPMPAPRPTDGLSPQHMATYSARVLGYRGAIADAWNTCYVKPNAHMGDPRSPPEISTAVLYGSGTAAFDRIKAPTLGFFAYPEEIPPYVEFLDLTPEQQENYKFFRQK